MKGVPADEVCRNKKDVNPLFLIAGEPTVSINEFITFREQGADFSRTIRMEDGTCKMCGGNQVEALVLHQANGPTVVSYCQYCKNQSFRQATAADITHAQQLEIYRAQGGLAHAG
jgi:hypothetical protein